MRQSCANLSVLFFLPAYSVGQSLSRPSASWPDALLAAKFVAHKQVVTGPSSSPGSTVALLRLLHLWGMNSFLFLWEVPCSVLGFLRLKDKHDGNSFLPTSLSVAKTRLSSHSPDYPSFVPVFWYLWQLFNLVRLRTASLETDSAACHHAHLSDSQFLKAAVDRL